MLFRSNDTATTEIYTWYDTLSLHDALPIDLPQPRSAATREDPRFFELATEVREALHLGGGYDLPLAATGRSEGAA